MTRRGKQNYKCRDCGRQFVENPQSQPKSPDTLSKIKLLLLERISLARIAYKFNDRPFLNSTFSIRPLLRPKIKLQQNRHVILVRLI